MSVVIRSVGNIGPFKHIEMQSDRLVCDGVDYPFNVIGQFTISNDDSLAPPLPPPAPEPHDDAVARINAEFEAEMDKIGSQYPDAEREGWPQQQLEAEAFIKDKNAPTPILDAMVAASGEDKNELALGIAAKVAAYSTYYGSALGRKRKKIAELNG